MLGVLKEYVSNDKVVIGGQSGSRLVLGRLGRGHGIAVQVHGVLSLLRIHGVGILRPGAGVARIAAGVAGIRGRSFANELYLGSVSSALTHRALCSVLIVR